MNQIFREYTFAGGQRLQLVQGDLTTESTDAIINAANSYLKHGGGIAGAIVRRGGASIQAESNEWVRKHGPITHDKPAFTGAGSLPCQFIIHAVGPVWGETSPQDADQSLAAAIFASLRIADERELVSLSIPAVSTGIFEFPKLRAAGIILEAVKGYFASHPGSGLLLVRLTILEQPTLDAFIQAWAAAFPNHDHFGS
jgi:O-acetyl-ADP-ribose deacetylase